ncbi:PREDICTED: uncharacterized protein LOC109114769 [Nelumbo nucifera]|uniref:Uncharacterized protein LOC109114769 n=1 Tax=Nelumbo nucifera TaxID=4432 RepID=A0A1U8Q4E3_NELNU|nr:PREDICTED: uncharacterized protein LOC109114769 [Nelumbo nucifera]
MVSVLWDEYERFIQGTSQQNTTTLACTGQSPFFVLFPTLSHFPLTPRVFGYVCFVHNLGHGMDKLDARSKCDFLGYSMTQKGYESNIGKILLVVYVDDIVITGSDRPGIDRLKTYLQDHLQTKDFGKLRYSLGLEVARSKNGINLCQRKYVLDLLEETGLLGARPAETLMGLNAKLGSDTGEEFKDPGRYRRLVGKLNYLTNTRPDISFAISVVNQFMSNP